MFVSDDEFARIVGNDVKNKVSTRQREILNLPENWERWQRALESLLENLDDQLRSVDEREEYDRQRYEALGEDGAKLLVTMLSESDERKQKISRFRYHVERKLEAVRRLEASQSVAVAERAKLVEFLRNAIIEHQAMTVDVNFEPTPIDLALWAALDGKWHFDSIDTSEL